MAQARSSATQAGRVSCGGGVGFEAGEIDVVAVTADLLAVVEVKARRTLAEAALALGARQRARLLAAAEILLAQHPEWSRPGMRFDLMVVDAAGTVRRIADAFRLEN